MSPFFATLTILVVLTYAELPGRTVGSSETKAEPYFIGSSPADIRHYPYQASVMVSGGHRCCGVIISRTWVVTTYNCVRYVAPRNLSVRVGSGNVLNGGKIHAVAQMIGHPYFNSGNLNNDLALLNFTIPFAFNVNVSSVPMIGSNQNVTSGVIGWVSGWGPTSKVGPAYSPTLRQVPLPVVNQTTCNNFYRGLYTKNMMCAGYTNEQKTVSAQGCPLVVNGRLVGVSSFSQLYKPEVFTRIAAVRAWISSVTKI